MNSILGCVITMVWVAHPGHAVSVKVNNQLVLKSYMTMGFPDYETCRMNPYFKEGCVSLNWSDKVDVYGGSVTIECKGESK